MERHVLVVFPHPDDESFGVSGTMAKYIKNGTPVTYACLTLGEMGRAMGDPIIANRETLPQLRTQELLVSCSAIGLTDLRMMGLHDKTIEFEDPKIIDTMLDGLLAEIKPSLVITFHPEYAVHPDHNATGAAVIRAVKRLPASERPVVHTLAFAKGCEEVLGQPDVVNDVTDFLEQKINSIQAHRTQWQLDLGNKKPNSKQIVSQFGTERFWTYSVQD